MSTRSVDPVRSAEAPARAVLVVDNDAAYRVALAEAIATMPDMSVIATASNVEDGIALAVALRPVLVVVDVRMPNGGGARVARELSRRMPDLGILALSVHDDAEHQREMLGAGADAFLVKGGPIEELLATMRALCQ